MLLPEWDSKRIEERIPLVLAAVGARRCGKSTAICHLLYQMFERFDLVIAFVGSAACSPCLEAMMDRHPNWDSRFFFPQWNTPLIEKLLRQQESLKHRGIERHVLILCDDVVLTGKDEEQLAHMALRGRHFNISIMMCAVSYTTINKRVRRSLDCLLCFSCPMQGDRKILSWEFASNSSTADFVMNNLDENQCVVFETSRKRQKLALWKAELLTPEMFRMKRLPDLGLSRTVVSLERPERRLPASHQIENASPSNGTECQAPGGVHVSGQSIGHSAPSSPKNRSPTVPVSTSPKHTES